MSTTLVLGYCKLAMACSKTHNAKGEYLWTNEALQRQIWIWWSKAQKAGIVLG